MLLERVSCLLHVTVHSPHLREGSPEVFTALTCSEGEVSA